MSFLSVAGGWIGSSIVSNVVSSIISYVKKDQSEWQLGFDVDLKRLEEELPMIQALLEAIDRCQIKGDNLALEKWLWQFRDAVDEAEDFMDEMDYYRLEEEIHGDEQSTVSLATSQFKRAKVMFKRGVHQDPTLERLKNIVKRLDDAAAEVGVFVELVKTLKQRPVVTSSRQTSSLLTVETRMYGRDNEKNEVINKLLNFNPTSKKNFSILPIVGVGGIGKTTLAQCVYNDKKIDNHFDKKMWVCVSNTFDVLSLTKKIYEEVFGSNHPTDNFNRLQRELLKFLESKKILLMLDDVWNDDDRESWDKLLAPFSLVERGSMILLTTRMEKVAKMMTGAMKSIFLKGLCEEDYWEFFKDCAFRDEDAKQHNKLQDIGRKIAGKLKRSPLAAKTVGGILSTNLDDKHWENILHSEIWELKQGENDIMPALRLSYQYLPSHLKPCFRFCSIFPQDHYFEKEKLVYMWMALGLLQEPINGNRRPEDVGYEYLNDLVRRSLFDCTLSGLFYVMHDLLHELAVFVSRGECFRIEENSEPMPIPTSVRHLSINTFALLPIPEITKLKHLRTLLLLKRPNPGNRDVPEMIKGMISLRILASSTVEISDACISNLKLLRYLSNEYRIYRVPESVNKLYHLQFLYCNKYIDPSNELGLADSIHNLINLRRLGKPNSGAGIGRLSSLQILEEFNVEENGNNLFELKNLRELRELSINDLQKAKEGGQMVSEAKLNDKEHLQILTLRWSDRHRSSGSPTVDEQVLDALQPHPNLKNLTIKNYTGCRSPHWMTTENLALWKLKFISLSKCKGWVDLPSLGQLPYLESLLLFEMDSVKQVGSPPDRGTKVGVFPSLQVLHIRDMPALEEFCGGGAGTTPWLSCLQSLRISECPKMRVFPNLPCGLKYVEISDVSWAALPELWQGEKNSSLSISSSISLENLFISKCGELTHLPIGGFAKFTSLKQLEIKDCPKLLRGSTSGRFLPPSLQWLSIQGCDVLDPFPSAPEDLNFLCAMVLRGCASITSLPPAEVLGKWKALRKLSIEVCSELESLGGLHSFSSLKSLVVYKCPKLVAAASSSPSTLVFEVRRPTKSAVEVAQGPVEAPTSSSSSLILDKLDIDDLLLLCTVPLRSISTREVYISHCGEAQSSVLEEWVLKNRSSLQKLHMINVSSRQFPLVDLKSLSSLELLDITWCKNLRSLPELPSSLKRMWIGNCPPELKERCLKDSGSDWPKIQHIPDIIIGKYSKEELATTTLAEYRSRERELEIQKRKKNRS
ncbi:putative disease resistance protein RGA1 [Typha angustifolia]|uniref:putative disease resistance protein RGA1 n=1 Tax=Typha angustifolia TaxID=59011 RepID=UPI003C2FA143